MEEQRTRQNSQDSTHHATQICTETTNKKYAALYPPYTDIYMHSTVNKYMQQNSLHRYIQHSVYNSLAGYIRTERATQIYRNAHLT